MPPRNASTKTTVSGKTRKRPRNRTVTPISTAFVRPLSVVGDRRPERSGALNARSNMAVPSPRPGLNEVDGEEHDEGDHEHDRGDGARTGIVEFLKTDHDQ